MKTEIKKGKPEVNVKFFLRLFWETFTLSMSGFGGGFVIVSLMRKKMVAKLGWIDQDEMMDFVIIAQSAPGSASVNVAMMVGYHLARTPGALVATLGTVLPPMIIVSIISVIYTILQGNVWVDAAFLGMRPVVAAIVLQVSWKFFKPFLKVKAIPAILLFIISFVLLYILKVSMIALILVMLALSTTANLLDMRRRKKRMEEDI
ncbi:MAG TPA: chromate transporter [Sphaerochaeta sp.]|jgi:chromate transporter|nr:chromate transporter [Spirochaetota bacterium]HNZ95217.1 chromate transporter [Sphaerochaeta sp.]HPB42634.1 chromate transporter [Sphaerochaeta sp.]HPY45884.1 chromate transporter [Sphaerochaeta sp.]HQB05477.1 chromate transporter [Sphaerochaeta sp.]